MENLENNISTVYVGDKKVSSIYVGDKKICRVYKGEDLIYSDLKDHVIG